MGPILSTLWGTLGTIWGTLGAKLGTLGAKLGTLGGGSQPVCLRDTPQAKIITEESREFIHSFVNAREIATD